MAGMYVRSGPAWFLFFVCLGFFLGGGCWMGDCFSKSYLFCLSSLSFLLQFSLLSPSSLPTLNFGKHICSDTFCFGMSPPLSFYAYV